MNYSPEHPVQEPSDFFGHQRLTRRVLSFIKRSQNVSLVGPQKIGKTSLLNYVLHPDIARQNDLATDDYLFVYIDCCGLAQKNKGETYQYIGQLIHEKLKPLRENSIRPVERFDDLSRLCRQLARRQLKIVIALDHFDVLTQNAALDIVFFDSLRSLAYHLTYLVASRRSLYELQEKAPRISGSPFFNIFQTFDVPPLAPPDQHALFNHWGQQLQLPQDMWEWIKDWLDGYPYDMWQLVDYASTLFRSSEGNSVEQWINNSRHLLEERFNELLSKRSNSPES